MRGCAIEGVGGKHCHLGCVSRDTTRFALVLRKVFIGPFRALIELVVPVAPNGVSAISVSFDDVSRLNATANDTCRTALYRATLRELDAIC